MLHVPYCTISGTLCISHCTIIVMLYIVYHKINILANPEHVDKQFSTAGKIVENKI